MNTHPHNPWAIGIGIDPSLVNTRICVKRRRQDPNGHWQIPDDPSLPAMEMLDVKTSAKLSSHERALQILNQVNTLVDAHLFTRPANTRVIICCENYSFGSAQGAHQLGEVGFAVRMGVKGATRPLNDPAGCWPVLIEPKRLKKYVSNSGNASKAVVMKDVLKLWGFDTSDDNDADAFVLSEIALGLAGADIRRPAYQVDTLVAIRAEQGPQIAAFLQGR